MDRPDPLTFAERIRSARLLPIAQVTQVSTFTVGDFEADLPIFARWEVRAIYSGVLLETGGSPYKSQSWLNSKHFFWKYIGCFPLLFVAKAEEPIPELAQPPWRSRQEEFKAGRIVVPDPRKTAVHANGMVNMPGVMSSKG